ncbi:glycosyltransferase [Ethanoligenens sp.]|uniref:glycosyltransferase n=1 Tax=Ethanoligenens sp. TaxID=2099655 RepID=UPI0039E7D810
MTNQTTGTAVKETPLQQMPFSVLLPVCSKERPEWLDACLHSLLCQTVMPTEILLLEDGALSDGLRQVVDKHTMFSNGLLRVCKLPGGAGLGEMLRQGVLACRCPLIARMDADDICMPFRFEKQLQVLFDHPDYDIVGCNILEQRQEGMVCRCVPEWPDEIHAFAHWRNPFCHMTVLVRKDAVLRAGNYRIFSFFEDYDLWIRLLSEGAKGYNIQENLMYVRAFEQQSKRRGGHAYLKAEAAFFRQLRHSGYIGARGYAVSLLVRGMARMAPEAVREWLYLHTLRRNVKRCFS